MYNLAKTILVLFTFPILIMMVPLSIKIGISWLLFIVILGLFLVIIWQAISFVENIVKW